MMYTTEVIQRKLTALSTHSQREHIIVSSFKSSMCGVLKCCGIVACRLNICVYAPLILGAIISVDSAPALQAL